MKINKLLGVLFFLVGLKVILIQDWNSNWIEYSFSDNYLYIPIGVILIYIGFKFFNSIPQTEEKISICPKCQDSFEYDRLDEGKCKNCKDEKTIDIKEYYKNN
jgi:hypothetical protein